MLSCIKDANMLNSIVQSFKAQTLIKLSKMNKIVSISLLFLIIILNGCTNSQTSNTNLSAIDFKKKFEEISNEQIIDVRTPQEFSEGHIENAINIDWNGSNFENEISKIDTSTPIFIYCLGGGRSAAAAAKMKEMGFKDIVELNGGMMNWRSAGLPETKNNSVAKKSDEISLNEFKKQIQSDKIVIVDYFAVWCAPCKKMKPHLEEIAKEMVNEVVVIKIDVDKNPTLAQEMKIEGLPTLQFYKAGKLFASKLGYSSKEEIIQQLK